MSRLAPTEPCKFISRIIRYTYAQDYYTELMFDAYKLWRDAEKESATRVFTQTGGLDFGLRDNQSLLNVIANNKKFAIEHETFTDSAQLSKRFPMVKLLPGHIAVYTPSSGILNATKAVAMFQQLARGKGCILRDNSPVTNVASDHTTNLITVELANGEKIRTKKCILTGGPWTNKILMKAANIQLPLNPIQPTIAYWKVEKPEEYSSQKFPVFINYDKPLLYGTPAHEFPNLIKCAAHWGPDCDPDSRTFDPGFDTISEEVSPWLQQTFTGVSVKPQMTESCMYTESPDYDFIIDQIPGFADGNFLVGCGFSGHGFKLAPVVGKLLAMWAITDRFPYSQRIQDVFSIKRFDDGQVQYKNFYS